MCLTGAVVSSWSLKQDLAGWQVCALLLKGQIFFSLNSVNSVKTFKENSTNLFSWYRSGTINSKSFVGKVLLRIKRKFELN